MSFEVNDKGWEGFNKDSVLLVGGVAEHKLKHGNMLSI